MTEKDGYPHACEHPRAQHLGPEGVCQMSGCMCIAADYLLHHDPPVDEWTEDFRERWRHLDPFYPEVCGLRDEFHTAVCIMPLDHEETHGWEDGNDA